MGAAANCRPPSAPFFFIILFSPSSPPSGAARRGAPRCDFAEVTISPPCLPSPLQPQPPPPPISGTAICIAARPLPPPLPLRPPSQPRGVRQRSGGSAGAHLAAAAPTRAALYPPPPCMALALRPLLCARPPFSLQPPFFAPPFTSHRTPALHCTLLRTRFCLLSSAPCTTPTCTPFALHPSLLCTSPLLCIPLL